MHQKALINIKKKSAHKEQTKITFSKKGRKMINATALYYKYSKVLYTNSRIMYIAKFKNPTRNE